MPLPDSTDRPAPRQTQHPWTPHLPIAAAQAGRAAAGPSTKPKLEQFATAAAAGTGQDLVQIPAELNTADGKAMEDFQKWYDSIADKPTHADISLIRDAQNIATKYQLRLDLGSTVSGNGRQVPFAERLHDWPVFAIIGGYLTQGNHAGAENAAKRLAPSNPRTPPRIGGAPEQNPSWVTPPPDPGAVPSDQQLQAFVVAARQAGETWAHLLAADLRKAGWTLDDDRAWKTWDGLPWFVDGVAITWPPPKSVPKGQKLPDRGFPAFIARARRQGETGSANFSDKLHDAGWKLSSTTDIRRAWRNEADRAIVGVAAKWPPPKAPYKRAKLKDDDLRAFLVKAVEAKQTNRDAVFERLHKDWWQLDGNAQQQWNAVRRRLVDWAGAAAGVGDRPGPAEAGSSKRTVAQEAELPSHPVTADGQRPGRVVPGPVSPPEQAGSDSSSLAGVFGPGELTNYVQRFEEAWQEHKAAQEAGYGRSGGSSDAGVDALSAPIEDFHLAGDEAARTDEPVVEPTAIESGVQAALGGPARFELYARRLRNAFDRNPVDSEEVFAVLRIVGSRAERVRELEDAFASLTEQRGRATLASALEQAVADGRLSEASAEGFRRQLARDSPQVRWFQEFATEHGFHWSAFASAAHFRTAVAPAYAQAAAQWPERRMPQVRAFTKRLIELIRRGHADYAMALLRRLDYDDRAGWLVQTAYENLTGRSLWNDLWAKADKAANSDLFARADSAHWDDAVDYYQRLADATFDHHEDGRIPIPTGYPDGGAKPRAHLWVLRLRQWGVNASEVYALSEPDAWLCVNSENALGASRDAPRPVTWKSHVAPTIKVDYGDGQAPVDMVLDPALGFGEPVPISKWLETIGVRRAYDLHDRRGTAPAENPQSAEAIRPAWAKHRPQVWLVPAGAILTPSGDLIISTLARRDVAMRMGEDELRDQGREAEWRRELRDWYASLEPWDRDLFDQFDSRVGDPLLRREFHDWFHAQSAEDRLRYPGWFEGDVPLSTFGTPGPEPAVAGDADVRDRKRPAEEPNPDQPVAKRQMLAAVPETSESKQPGDSRREWKPAPGTEVYWRERYPEHSKEPINLMRSHFPQLLALNSVPFNVQQRGHLLNCINVAVGVVETLSGRKFTPAPSTRLRPNILFEWHFSNQSKRRQQLEPMRRGPDEIVERLIQEGPGSHGIVRVQCPNGGGHVFNAIYDSRLNAVVFIDAQAGRLASVSPDNEYSFLLTSRKEDREDRTTVSAEGADAVDETPEEAEAPADRGTEPPAMSQQAPQPLAAGAGPETELTHPPASAPDWWGPHSSPTQPRQEDGLQEAQLGGPVGRVQGVSADAVASEPRLSKEQLDFRYGPTVPPKEVKQREKGESGELRLNPLWYRLADFPRRLLVDHPGVIWLYVVDEDGQIRIGAENIRSVFSEEEWQRLTEGLASAGHSFEQMQDKMGHPTVAAVFTEDGRTIPGWARISGELWWNAAANGGLGRWEVNEKSGRYMGKVVRPNPDPKDVMRWVSTVADDLAAHFSVDFTPTLVKDHTLPPVPAAVPETVQAESRETRGRDCSGSLA